MSTRETADLSKVILILGSFVGVNDILTLSENSRYEFRPPPGNASTSWRGGQPELRPPFLALTIGKDLYDPRGWVLGSDADSDECDLQLAATNQTGISRRFIRIDISPVTHNPRLTVLSDITIRMRDGRRILPCTPGKPQEFLRPVTVDLGAVSFRAWPPIRSTQETRAYKQHARQFSEDILRAVPKYIPSIKKHPATATHNVRYGKGNAVYVNELGIQSKGTGASVMMVTERSSRKVFGAKEPYYAINDGHDAARKRLEALQQEYEHIMKLDHPHIVKAYDLVLAEDVTLPPWMIVEYIPLNLRDILVDLDEHHKPMVLTHLASALQYIHSENVTHRDVKPDNVLVQKQDQQLTVKLADFGTSTHNAAGKMNTFTGTERYMAPELFQSPRRYTDKVDMWSLGLIGVQLFTTWDPATDDGWSPSDFGSWMRKVILPHIEEAPKQFRPLLKGLLLKNPNQRWSAQRCLMLLWKYQVDNAPDDEGPVNTRKRSASKLDEPLPNNVDRERRRRSPNPSLSTARARAVPHAEHHSEGESSLPDTLSPGAWVPKPVSAAPTPTPEGGLSDLGDVEAEDGSSDTEPENDWREDQDQDEENER